MVSIIRLSRPPAVALAAAVCMAVSLSITSIVRAGEAAPRPTAEGASAFMTQLVTDAGAALSASGESLEQREAAFRALLRDGFDMAFISRVAMGRNWKDLSPPDQQAYTDLFSDFVLRTYAPRLGGFDPTRFKATGAEPKGRQDMLVNTSIEQAGGSTVSAGWRVRLVEQRHRIVDIVVEGVSMTLNQRREFTSVIRQGGVAGLMEMLRARTERLSVEPPS